MKEVKIIWEYPADTNNGTWKNSETPEYVFHVDNIRDIYKYPKCKNVLILYEPNSILPDNYLESIGYFIEERFEYDTLYKKI